MLFLKWPRPFINIFKILRVKKKRENNKNIESGASLAVQWLRVYLEMQGAPVWSLVREDPTRHGATKPVPHSG